MCFLFSPIIKEISVSSVIRKITSISQKVFPCAEVAEVTKKRITGLMLPMINLFPKSIVL